MTHIKPEHIAKAVLVVNSLNVSGKKQLVDEIFQTQPNLLASILVLKRLATPDADLEVALNILFICYEAVRASNIKIANVSEVDYECCLARVVGRANFIEGLSSEMRVKAIESQIKDHGEPFLLALVLSELQAHNLAEVKTELEKRLLISVLNLVESIAYVAKDVHTGSQEGLSE